LRLAEKDWKPSTAQKLSTGDRRKRKKMTRKEHKDTSHDLGKLQTSKKKQTVEEEANHESVPKC
jgi:hypothetical protein